jgi:uncharacterized protein YcbX
MVVDEGGRFITQRELPVLATMTPEFGIAFGKPCLGFKAEGWERRADGANGYIGVVLEEYLNRRDKPVVVTVWGDTVEAYSVDDGEDGIDDRLSTVLGRRVRLVIMDSSADQRLSRGQLDDAPAVFNSFADGFPFLLTSQESLADLNTHIGGDSPIGMERFRPNIVVSGCDSAFDEENWRTFQIGGVTFYGMKRCGRCIVTTTDQRSGERMGREPLRTLAQYHRFGKDACFGMNLNHNAPGVIRIGDEVEVVERGSPRIDN